MPLDFATPVLLWSLLLVPVALVAYLVAQRQRTRYAVRFTNLDLLATVVPRTPGWRRHVPAALYLLALSVLLLSLGRPQASIPVPKDRATVVMVMDISGSMTATDVQPNRLLAAKSSGKQFLDQLPSTFRVAVVAFSTTVQTLLRPTTDRAVAREAIESLQAEGGTAMGDAIARAVEIIQSIEGRESANPATPVPGAPTATPVPGAPTATPGGPFGSRATPAPLATSDQDSPPPAAILLLSDGANTTGRIEPLEAARQARQLGIPIYTIALGTPLGTVEVRDQLGFRQRLPVPPDEPTLRRIAEITGGQFFTAPTAADLNSVYRNIGSRIGFIREPLEITAAFAAAGALLLLAGGGLSLLWFNRFP